MTVWPSAHRTMRCERLWRTSSLPDLRSCRQSSRGVMVPCVYAIDNRPSDVERPVKSPSKSVLLHARPGPWPRATMTGVLAVGRQAGTFFCLGLAGGVGGAAAAAGVKVERPAGRPTLTPVRTAACCPRRTSPKGWRILSGRGAGRGGRGCRRHRHSEVRGSKPQVMIRRKGPQTRCARSATEVAGGIDGTGIGPARRLPATSCKLGGGSVPTAAATTGCISQSSAVISAHTNPASSRATAAATTDLESLRAPSARNRPHSRRCASHDRATVAGPACC